MAMCDCMGLCLPYPFDSSVVRYKNGDQSVAVFIIYPFGYSISST